ncbi:polyketide cyclase [Agromyces intestinalis]|uniref:Polyketide cyclase n=1 Tax=Agromyces intestinalis TaxID=2592652 RepID=A0A5C1YH77_9MICO|nr:SRPBCC family protein [Agromyces intestinalis]QEO14915.1 polyketide cyclase [Agromyces intestinalis]
MTDHAVLHSSFTLERTYPHPPARVFAALADRDQKAKWFGGAGDPDTTWEFDFREGGRELQHGPFEGRMSTYDAIYHDIVDDERVVYSYTMVIDGTRLSASLATFELSPTDDGGTHLTLTEQGAYFDDVDDPAERERGTAELLDLLGATLAD